MPSAQILAGKKERKERTGEGREGEGRGLTVAMGTLKPGGGDREAGSPFCVCLFNLCDV